MDFPLQTLDHLKPLIQGFRKRANLTQTAMAEKLGISQQSYAQIESNLASTSVERLFTILRLMNVSIQLTDCESNAVPDSSVMPSTTGHPVEGKVPSHAGRKIGAAPAKVVKPQDTTKW